MNHVKNLIKAHRHLLNRVKKLEADNLGNVYYEKYLKLSEENLNLKERIHKLELENSVANREIEKRDNIIRQLRNS